MGQWILVYGHIISLPGNTIILDRPEVTTLFRNLLTVIKIKAMRYIYLGAFMLLVGTIFAIVVDWRLAVILFLVVQGNEIVQRANKKINKKIKL